MKKNIKLVLVFILGGFIGGLISAIILVNYIGTQRNQGFHDGDLNARIEIMDFLNKNIKNDISKIKRTDKYLTVKDASIVIIEIDGIKTILVE